MSRQITRRSFLAGAAGLTAAAVTPLTLSSCSTPTEKTVAQVLIDAGPLIALMMSGYGEIGMLTGLVDPAAELELDAAGVSAVRTLYDELKNIIDKPGVKLAGQVTNVAFTYAFGHLPIGAMSAFVTALWRGGDGKPASLTRAAKLGNHAFSIPTPAQFGVSLLAHQYMTNWKQQLESSGQCVSLAELANHTAAIFAPSDAAHIKTPGVTELHVTEPAQYVYWTTGGAPVTVHWQPSTNAKKQSSISASYKSVWGGPDLAVPVAPYHGGFPFHTLWSRRSSSSPIVLNEPPAHPAYNSTTVLPSGSGTVQGAWAVKNGLNSSRTITGQGSFIEGEGMTGEFFLSLTGKPYGANWVQAAPHLPMTMTYIPGDCAIYSGDVTLAGQSLTSELSGPSGGRSQVIEAIQAGGITAS